MKRRKMKSKEKGAPSIAQVDEVMDQIFSDAREQAAASTEKRQEHALRMHHIRAAQEQASVKRDISQLDLKHWWKDPVFRKRFNESEISIEEQKASLWYEAARRRKEVRDAWLEGRTRLLADGRQEFTGWVVQHLPFPWPALDETTQQSIIKASYSPLAVPPAGLSTFPDDKAEQSRVSFQVVRPPEPDALPDELRVFAEYLRRLLDAGFLIVAVDKKINKAVRVACNAIAKLPQTFRKADTTLQIVQHLPSNISHADRLALEKKLRDGTLSQTDVDQVWRKYSKRDQKVTSPWDRVGEARNYISHKRQRKGRMIEGMQFQFLSICRELENFDEGKVSDFVQSVRL